MKNVSLALALLLGMFASASQPMAQEKESPLTIEGAKTVTPADAKALFDKGVKFIDLRTDAAYEAGRIPGSVHIEFKTKFSEEALATNAKKDQEVVFYCSGPTCWRAPEASQKAVSWGYSKVNFFREGFPGWQAAGYPVE